MRLHVISDLHQEFGAVDLPTVDSDCVVIAGDVSTKHHGFQWIRERFRDVPVVYICGNHEFYGDKLPRLTERLREEARGTNVHFLENDAVSINSVHFFGCTLWTDIALHGDWHQPVGLSSVDDRRPEKERERTRKSNNRALRLQK